MQQASDPETMEVPREAIDDFRELFDFPKKQTTTRTHKRASVRSEPTVAMSRVQAVELAESDLPPRSIGAIGVENDRRCR